jgi:hypothetical protein
MSEYADIVFMQGDDADAALEYAENGEHFGAALIEYLSQWDYGDVGEVRDALPHGSRDDSYEAGDYVVSWNRGTGNCGLVRVLA